MCVFFRSFSVLLVASCSLTSCLQNRVLLHRAIRFWPSLLHHHSVRSLIGSQAKMSIDGGAHPRISGERMCMNFAGRWVERKKEVKKATSVCRIHRPHWNCRPDGEYNTTIYGPFTFIGFIEYIVHNEMHRTLEVNAVVQICTRKSDETRGAGGRCVCVPGPTHSQPMR